MLKTDKLINKPMIKYIIVKLFKREILIKKRTNLKFKEVLKETWNYNK